MILNSWERIALFRRKRREWPGERSAPRAEAGKSRSSLAGEREHHRLEGRVVGGEACGGDCCREGQLVYCRMHVREDKGPGSCVGFAARALLASLPSADSVSEGDRPA